MTWKCMGSSNIELHVGDFLRDALGRVGTISGFSPPTAKLKKGIIFVIWPGAAREAMINPATYNCQFVDIGSKEERLLAALQEFCNANEGLKKAQDQHKVTLHQLRYLMALRGE